MTASRQTEMTNLRQEERSQEQTQRTDNGQTATQAELVSAMLQAVGAFECSQLTEEQLYSAASVTGNQMLLSALENQQRSDEYLNVAQILRGGSVPQFVQTDYANEVNAEAFSPVSVPQFEYSGGRAAEFGAVHQMALDVSAL